MGEPVPEQDLRPQVYREERGAQEFVRFHERAKTRGADWIYSFARVILTPIVVGPMRLRAIGTENVPASGPVILAPNHFSSWDHFMVACFVRRPLQFMAKSQLFSNPVITFILTHGGAFPVRRGHADEEAFVTAHSILDRGGLVGVYAEGGRTRTGTFGEPRPGLGRLALESGVPVVPVAIHGSLDVRGWRRGRFPRIEVRYGEPLRFDRVGTPSREEQLATAEAIFARVRELYGD